jgi:hypothetical protein
MPLARPCPASGSRSGTHARAGELRLEEIGVLHAGHLTPRGPRAGGEDPGALGQGEEGADGNRGLATDLDGVRAEHRERVVVIGVDNAVDLVAGRGEAHRFSLLWRAGLKEV